MPISADGALPAASPPACASPPPEEDDRCSPLGAPAYTYESSASLIGDQPALEHARVHVLRAVQPRPVAHLGEGLRGGPRLDGDGHIHVIAKVVRLAERSEQPMERRGPVGRDDRHIDARQPPLAQRVRGQRRDPIERLSVRRWRLQQQR
eukprot:2779357-Prymnesium_polylepis.1